MPSFPASVLKFSFNACRVIWKSGIMEICQGVTDHPVGMSATDIGESCFDLFPSSLPPFNLFLLLFVILVYRSLPFFFSTIQYFPQKPEYELYQNWTCWKVSSGNIYSEGVSQILLFGFGSKGVTPVPPLKKGPLKKCPIEEG